MATTPDLQEPLIAAARAQAWHQTGEALLTLEAARSWVESYGLLLFAPRAGTLGAPAPSLVEATLGEGKGTTTLAEADVARTLLARMVGEGSAVPLNLLGGPGDVPDFLVSAQAFPFIFTLRGDKGWKRAPETSGSVKVTPLGLRVYELLAEKGALTVGDIVNEVGREITESAVTRALGELWQILRVIPVLQQGEGDTRWELITSRFLKAVKAGANAGQPTALSGLISLYLQQSLVATEEEIAAFLSPLTARSRVRDVVHGLSAGRQLAEGVVNGKAVLYVPEMLPNFTDFAPSREAQDEEASSPAPAEAGATGDEASGEAAVAPRKRIQSFDREGGHPQGNFRGKPVSRGQGSGGFRDGGRPARPGFNRGPRPDRSEQGSRGTERRPFTPREGRPSGGFDAGKKSFGAGRAAGERSSFARPWDEERSSRPPREGAPSTGTQNQGARPPREDRGGRPERPFRSNDGRPPRRFDDRGPRPPFRREGRPGGASSAGDRGFAPRGDRPQRPFRDRPAGDKPFRPREDRGDLPFRPREGGGDRPFTPRAGGGDRPFRPRPEGGGGRPFQPRDRGGDRPFRPREGGDRPFRPRTEGGGRPFQPRSGSAGGDRPFRPRPSGEGSGRPSGGFDRPRGDRPAGGPGGDRREGGRPSFGNRSGGGRPSFGARPQGSGGFRPSGRPGGKVPNRPDRAPRKPRPEDEA